jgi:predicted NUDIX family NTP pyrophosphohydrolase
LLFHQEKGQLKNVSAASGPVFGKMFSARGLAIGDFDNDGRIDVLVGNNGGPPLLLRNNAGAGNHWLGVKLVGTKCNRDAVGAKLTWSAGGVTRSRLKNNGGSYLSSHDMREVLGVGQAAKLDWLEVEWPKPSGRKERLTGLPVDRYITLTEGSAGGGA